MEIFFVKTKNQGLINLIKSFLLVLNITLSNQILFTNGIGLLDLGSHINLVLSIVNNGYVPQTGGYQYFPGHHILVAISSLIAGSYPKLTYLFLGGFLISLGIFYVFAIGKKFISLKFGLFAALIYTSLDYLIMYGSHPVHMSYIYSLSIVIFMMVLYVYENIDINFIILYIIVIISMVFMHHYSAFIILFVISALIIVEIFQRKKDRKYRFKLLGLARLYLVIILAQWMYYSNMLGSFTGIFRAYASAAEMGSKSIVEATAYDKLSISTLFLNTIGSSILILLSVIGFLYFLKDRSFFKNAIISITVIVGILLGIGVVLKQQWLLPDRMYPYLQLFGLVFLGSAGIILIDKIKTKFYKLKTVVVILIIMSLTFFSISSTIAGFETSLFMDEKTAYYKLYDSPFESYFNRWTASYVENNSTILENPPITLKGVDIQQIKVNSFIVFNKFYLKTGFITVKGGHLGQYDFLKLKENDFNLLYRYEKYYSNGMVDLFYSQGV